MREDGGFHVAEGGNLGQACTTTEGKRSIGQFIPIKPDTWSQTTSRSYSETGSFFVAVGAAHFICTMSQYVGSAHPFTVEGNNAQAGGGNLSPSHCYFVKYYYTPVAPVE